MCIFMFLKYRNKYLSYSSATRDFEVGGGGTQDGFEDKMETTETEFRNTKLSSGSKLDAPRGYRIEKLCCPSGPPLFRYTSRWG